MDDAARHYLDNASTTRVLPQVADVLLKTMQDTFANPASLYRAGLAAEQVVLDARATLAAAFGCQPKEVFFTSGGTEANNIAVLGATRARRAWGSHMVTTGYEHPSVSGPLNALVKWEGHTLTEVMPTADGRVDMDKMVAAVGPKTALVCAMQVNNENGALLDIAALAAAVKAKNPRTFVHVDGVQGFCKHPAALAATAIDGYATSGHKLHAPKGVGALYLRAGTYIHPSFFGGGQQQGIRPGTEAPALAAAYARAVELAAARTEADLQKATALRQRLLCGLAAIQGATVHSPQDASPYILIFSMPAGLRSQVLLNFLDESYGVCVSSGSACSGSAASHTLTAMGLPHAQVDTALRVSLCAQNTEDDIDALLQGLTDGARTLARRR